MLERITWNDLPAHLQHWVEEKLGSAVAEAHSQSSGFSLGTADRLICKNGTRAFLKAVEASNLLQTAELHRAELNAAQIFAGTKHTASLIGGYDSNGWVALILEDIEGKHPEIPWNSTELRIVLKALDFIATQRDSKLTVLDELKSSIEYEFLSWERIASNPLSSSSYEQLAGTSDLTELSIYFDELNERAEAYARQVAQEVLPSLEGDCLVHSDLRADNVLISSTTGDAVVIDWPFACCGAAYFDSATILADVAAQGGNFSWNEVAESSQVLAKTPQRTLEGFILAYAGDYLWSAQLAPTGATNSTLPAFRLNRALNLVRWLLG